MMLGEREKNCILYMKLFAHLPEGLYFSVTLSINNKLLALPKYRICLCIKPNRHPNARVYVIPLMLYTAYLRTAFGPVYMKLTCVNTKR